MTSTLSIAIPAFNRPQKVKLLLESIMIQIDEDDDVLVMDDGHSNELASITHGFHKVRYIRNETNLGMVKNWNACLSNSLRDWICIIHDDDELDENGIAALRQSCELVNRPALIVHNFKNDRCHSSLRVNISFPGDWSVLNCPTIPSGAIIHREIINQIGLFSNEFKYSSDLEYFARIASKFPVVSIENPRIIDYKLHGGNYQFDTWSKDDFFEQFVSIQKRIVEYAGVPDAERNQFIDDRIKANLFYMIRLASRLNRPELVRVVAKRFRRVWYLLTIKSKFEVTIANYLGRYIQFRGFSPRNLMRKLSEK